MASSQWDLAEDHTQLQKSRSVCCVIEHLTNICPSNTYSCVVLLLIVLDQFRQNRTNSGYPVWMHFGILPCCQAGKCSQVGGGLVLFCFGFFFHFSGILPLEYMYKTSTSQRSVTCCSLTCIVFPTQNDCSLNRGNI